MGLDLLHVRLSLKDDKTYEYFQLSELTEFPGFIENHKHLIVDMVEPDNFFHLYIFPNGKYSSQYQGYFEKNEHEIFLIGDVDKLANEIAQIEADNCLWPDGKLITRDTKETALENAPIPFINIRYPVSFVKEQVIYWKEVGHQRKGMDPDFYKDFENCRLYFKKDDVRKASNYLSADGGHLRWLPGHFKENFIDTFIEGESIFFASW